MEILLILTLLLLIMALEECMAKKKKPKPIRVATSVMILNEDNRALFVRRPKNDSRPLEYEFPGGRMDDDETDIASAARREVKEETGFNITDLKVIYTAMYETKLHRVVRVYFSSKYESGELTLTEHDDHKWLNIEEFVSSVGNIKFSSFDSILACMVKNENK